MTEHSCSRCGAVQDAPPEGMPPAWSVVVDGDGQTLLCQRCTREHIRDIEGKLDQAWWS